MGRSHAHPALGKNFVSCTLKRGRWPVRRRFPTGADSRTGRGEVDGQAPSVLCGRERELDLLLATWEKVKSPGAGPRVCVLLAESGLGKTRLAQEFFGRLSRSQGVHGVGYWPPELGRDGNNLRINPPEEDCNGDAELPFLWWGLRLVDPLAHNRIAAGVLAHHVERDLVPHLEPMYRAQRQRQRLARLAKIGGGLAADMLVDMIPFMGLVKSIGETGLELKELHSSWRKDREALDRDRLAAERRATLSERVIGDLRALFSGRAEARVPGVILIDDGQFSTHDPGLVEFVEALLSAMAGGGWPLLLLVTHWEREWAEHRAADAPTIARALDGHGRRHPGQVELLHLRPVADLSPLLRDRLPGLRPEQARALLERAGGNPRFLDEILRIALSTRGRALFVGRDPKKPMTDAGLADLLARSVALHDLVAERLAASPEPVQKAVALASMQGPEFLRRLVGETASALAEPADAIDGAISEAQNPHAYVAEVSEGVAAFAQRIYHEAARELLPAWFDPGDVEQALADVVRRIVTAPEGIVLSDTDLAQLCALAAALFEHSADEQDRRIAAASLSRLMDGAQARDDVQGALALARRQADVVGTISDDWLDGDLYWLRQLNRLFALASDHEARRPVLLRLAKMTQATHEAEPTPWSSWMFALAMVDVGDFFAEEGNAENMSSAWFDALATMDAVPRDELDTDGLETCIIVCDRVAGLLFGRGAIEDAERIRAAGLAFAAELNARDPGPARLNHLAAAERKLGNVALARGDLAAAEPHLTRALELCRQAAMQDARRGTEAALADTLLAVADLALMRDSVEPAEELVQEALAIRRRHREAADTVETCRGVALCLRKLATCRLAADDPQAAWTQMADVLESLRPAAATGDAELRSLYASCLTAASRIGLACRLVDEAGGLAEEALDLARLLARAADDLPVKHLLLQALAVALPHVAARSLPDALSLLADADATFAAIPEAGRWLVLGTMAEIEELRAKVLARQGDETGAAAARARGAALSAASAPRQDRADGYGRETGQE